MSSLDSPVASLQRGEGAGHAGSIAANRRGVLVFSVRSMPARGNKDPELRRARRQCGWGSGHWLAVGLPSGLRRRGLLPLRVRRAGQRQRKRDEQNEPHHRAYRVKPLRELFSQRDEWYSTASSDTKHTALT